jgi:hypothetical protein
VNAEDGHKNTYLNGRFAQGISPIVEILDIDDSTVCRSQHRLLVTMDEAVRIAEKIDRKNSQYPKKNSHKQKARVKTKEGYGASNPNEGKALPRDGQSIVDSFIGEIGQRIQVISFYCGDVQPIIFPSARADGETRRLAEETFDQWSQFLLLFVRTAGVLLKGTFSRTAGMPRSVIRTHSAKPCNSIISYHDLSTPLLPKTLVVVYP